MRKQAGVERWGWEMAGVAVWEMAAVWGWGYVWVCRWGEGLGEW